MERNENRCSLIKGLTLAVMSIGLITISSIESSAQTNDFFSNTQKTDQRSDGTDSLPGFNPCPGGTLTTSSCTGSTGLLNNMNLFRTLGPGAVTDNMFGLVSGTALGDLGASGGTGDQKDTPVTLCAPGFGTAGFDDSANGGLNGLNCGNVRILPSLQGQTIPGASDGNPLTGVFSTNSSMNMDSGTGVDQHHSQLENSFVWNPTASPVSLSVDTTNMPTINGNAPTADSCAGGTAANPTVCGQQSMQETTGLSASDTTKVDLTTSWTTTNSSPGGAMGGNPVVSWRMRIQQDDMVGTGAAFDQQLEGTFTYNGDPSFPTVQYPNGESFTNADLIGASLP